MRARLEADDEGVEIVDDAAADALLAAWSGAFAPPPELTVSEWADEKRRLPQASAARGGRWRTATTPYLRGIMDATRDPLISKIALMKCAQSGGSEALHNVLGYHIEHDPCPILLVHPTGDAAEAWSKERLADMLRSTPALAAVVTDKRQTRGGHQAESTLKLKMFPGGYLATGGANSPNTFARWSVRLAMGDDVDRFPPSIGEEGDPADLLVNRTRSFTDALVVMVSTPTMKGGRIETLYNRSDRRRYFVRCPTCGRSDWITWRGKDPDPRRTDVRHFGVVYEDDDPTTARLKCPDPDFGGCSARHDEATRRAMIATGEWRPTAKPLEPGLAGFHLPAMISTLGSVTLPEIVSKWLSAKARGPEALRVFVNTWLAESWEEKGSRVEPHALLRFREPRPEGVEVPRRASILTAGVDVQIDRFELLVFAWGAHEERWLVDWRTIPGDPKAPETRAALLQALGRGYNHALGPMVAIQATCIDSGYATEEIYDFVERNQARRVLATKGIAGRSGEPIVGKASGKTYGRRARPVPLRPINVDDAKRDVLNSVALLTAQTDIGLGEEDPPRPGVTHFPLADFADEEFFAQLCAEHRERRFNRAGVATHYVWVLDRTRNEALDCAVMAYAAYRWLNPNVQQALAVIEEAAARGEGRRPGGSGSPPPARGSATTIRPRRSSRSGYLGGG